MRFGMMILLALGMSASFAAPAQASAELQISGNLYSITSDDFVIRSGSRYYWIRKMKLNPAQRALLEKNPRGLITLHVAMAAIDQVKPINAKLGK